MTDFRIDVEIQAPPEIVWTIMRDVEHWPEWTPTVTSVRLLAAGPLAVGRRAIVRQPKLPPARWQVTELDDPGRSFAWVNRAPGLRVVDRHSVAARGAGSRATLSLQFSGVFARPVARLMRGLNDRYLALEAASARATGWPG